MTIAFWNIEGLRSKAHLIPSLITSSSLDALIVVESWLKPSDVPSLRLPSFTLDHIIQPPSRKSNKRGIGGITIIVPNSSTLERVYSCPCNHAGIWKVDGILVIGCYYPPSVSKRGMETSLTRLMAVAHRFSMKENFPVVMGGDFNTRLLDVTGDHVFDKDRAAILSEAIDPSLLSLLNSHISSSSTRWTYITDAGKSIPDLAFATPDARACLSIEVPPTNTPHQVLLVTTPQLIPNDNQANRNRWNWSRSRIANKKYCLMISDLLTPPLLLLTDLWSDISSLIVKHTSANKSVSTETQTIVDSLYDITADLIRSSVDGVVCWSPTNATRPFNHHIDIPEEDLNRMNAASFLSRVKRKLLSMENNIYQEDHDPSIQEFESLFTTTHLQRDQSGFSDPNDDPQYLDEIPPEFSIPIIRRMITKQKPFLSIGLDNLPMELFKSVSYPAARLFSVMFQLFYRTHTVPSIWNQSRVTLLLKKGKDRTKAENYRPISILPHLRKLYEKCLLRNLSSLGVITTHRLQFGFKKKTGCPDALYVVSEMYNHSKQFDRPLGACLLDIRKAFDTVHRGHIWKKLLNRGCHSHQVRVLRSIFDHCYFNLYFGNQWSSPIQMNIGIMQGTILSPTLCNILLDDLPEKLISAAGMRVPRVTGCPFPIMMYADDQTLFFHDMLTGQKLINVCSQYATDHNYSYNREKSVLVVPDRFRGDLTLDSVHIPKSPYSSLLGVPLRSTGLDPDQMASSSTTKAEYWLHRLVASNLLSSTSISPAKKKILLSSWVMSQYEYCIALLRLNRNSRERINSVIKKSVARCLQVKRATAPMMRFMGIIPAEARITWLQLKWRNKLRLSAVPQSDDRPFQSIVYSRSCKLPFSIASSWKRDTHWSTFSELADKQSSLPLVHQKSPLEIMYQIMSDVIWKTTNSRSKLSRIQTQPWNRPHCSAFFSSSHARLCHKWIVGLLPSMIPKLCLHCSGQHLLSKFHVCICTNVLKHLIPIYDLNIHLEYMLEIDNCIDSILQLQLACPDITTMKSKISKIGTAIQYIMDLVAPLNPEQTP
jgi:hypothetical protein